MNKELASNSTRPLALWFIILMDSILLGVIPLCTLYWLFTKGLGSLTFKTPNVHFWVSYLYWYTPAEIIIFQMFGQSLFFIPFSLAIIVSILIVAYFVWRGVSLTYILLIILVIIACGIQTIAIWLLPHLLIGSPNGTFFWENMLLPITRTLFSVFIVITNLGYFLRSRTHSFFSGEN